MTTDDIVRELVKTADLFGVVLSETRIQIYLESMDDLKPDDICAAFITLRRSEKFFPRPGDVRRAILGDPEELAEELWMLARNSGKGPLARALTGSETIALKTAVNAVGGWPMLQGQAQETRVQFIHREFVRAAALALKNTERRAQMERQLALPAPPKELQL